MQADSNEQYNDYDSALKAVQRDGMQLQNVSDDLRCNGMIATAAVLQTPQAIEFIHDDTPYAEMLCTYVLTKDLTCWKRMPSKFRDCKVLVKMAVKDDGMALEFASPRLRADEEIVRIAVQQNAAAAQFAKLSR